MSVASASVLPLYPREIYPHNKLAIVIVQVRVPPLTKLLDSEQVALEFMRGFDSAMAVSYPLRSVDRAVNIIFKPEGPETDRTSGERIFRYADVQQTRTVAVTPNFISFEVRNYQDGEEFIPEFLQILAAVRDHFDVRFQLRFGLRYINELTHPGGNTYEDWRNLINEELLGFRSSELLQGTVVQTLAELQLDRSQSTNENEKGLFVLRRGFLKGTTVPPLVGSTVDPQRPFYLLDMDYSISEPMQFDVRPVARIRAYNDFMFRFFRWALKDRMLAYLKTGVAK